TQNRWYERGVFFSHRGKEETRDQVMIGARDLHLDCQPGHPKVEILSVADCLVVFQPIDSLDIVDADHWYSLLSAVHPCPGPEVADAKLPTEAFLRYLAIDGDVLLHALR